MKKRHKRAARADRRTESGDLNPATGKDWTKLARLLSGCAMGVCIALAIWMWMKYKYSTLPDRYRPQPPATLTFNKDIALIMFSHCVVCHRPGQAAPFSLMSYEDVKKRAKQIAEVTQKRFMPPWLPEPGYGEFANERRLSSHQIEVIQEWVSKGAVEGVPSDLPPIPERTEGWQLGEPDLVVKMPEAYRLDPEGKDVYRNFVIPIPISERRYVEAVEFLPNNPKIVHHAFMKIDRTAQSRRLDEQDPQPGFSFMITPDTAQMPEGHFLSWTPGNVAAKEPEGLAWKLERGTDLVLQMHMNPTGKPELIQSSVGFHFTGRAPTNTPFKLLLTSRSIDIPAGQRDYLVKDTFVLPVGVEILAVLPHGHYLAKEMKGFATLPNGKREWLILIKDWNFNWQGAYRYAKPISLPKDTALTMQFSYDNSSDNPRNPHNPPQRVAYGPQTTDEMAELWFQVLPKNAEELSKLSKSFQEKMLKVFFDEYQNQVRIDPRSAQAHNKLGQTLLGFGRNQEALEHLRTAAKIQPDYEEPHFFLGYIFRHQKKLAESRAEYETVLRINPTNSEAYGNLGLVCFEQGNLSEAAAHFRDALRINPNDAVAKRNLELVLKAGAKAQK